MVKKGVSAEDKRDRMLKLIRESNTCWLIKDLEKAGAKLGVISQAVKDVVQSLVDDDLVCADKIGQSTWFWSFPSDAGQRTKRKLEMLEGELSRQTARLAELQARKEKAIAARPDESPAERDAKLLALRTMEARATKLHAELESHKENNPEHFNQLKEMADKAHEGANRWTDNVFMLQKWCEKSMDPGELKSGFKQLGCNLDTLDYLD